MIFDIGLAFIVYGGGAIYLYSNFKSKNLTQGVSLGFSLTKF